MNKKELEDIFKKLRISASEGIENLDNNNTYPRVVYWDFLWNPLTASGEAYNTKVTYQISFFSLIPRDPLLLELKHKLSSIKLNPIIQREYIKEKREWHSFFSLEVLENI